MAFEMSRMLVLTQEPVYPAHVDIVRRVPYHREVRVTPAAPPARFAGPVVPRSEDGPPWETIVFGVETDRFAMRERFVAQLRLEAAAGRDVEVYQHVLAGAFHRIFGGRGTTHETPGFVTWLRGAAASERDARVRACFEAALADRDDRPPRDGLVFDMETGHVPADHPAVLYWMSALVPGWEQVVFDQTDSPSEDSDPEAPHAVHAWWAGRRFDAIADNLGDFVDPWSCAGLINVMLRDVARTSYRLALDAEDQFARVELVRA